MFISFIKELLWVCSLCCCWRLIEITTGDLDAQARPLPESSSGGRFSDCFRLPELWIKCCYVKAKEWPDFDEWDRSEGETCLMSDQLLSSKVSMIWEFLWVEVKAYFKTAGDCLFTLLSSEAAYRCAGETGIFLWGLWGGNRSLSGPDLYGSFAVIPADSESSWVGEICDVCLLGLELQSFTFKFWREWFDSVFAKDALKVSWRSIQLFLLFASGERGKLVPGLQESSFVRRGRLVDATCPSKYSPAVILRRRSRPLFKLNSFARPHPMSR